MREGKLTARARTSLCSLHRRTGNRSISKKAAAAVKALAQRYDQGAINPDPGLTVRNVKLFLDGVITAPALTGAMLTPYLSLQGAPANPHWAPSANRGPDVYFPAPVLSQLLIEVAGAGFEPHMHADGDRAVREETGWHRCAARQIPGPRHPRRHRAQ